MLRRFPIYTALLLLFAGIAHADDGTVLVFPFENLSSDRSLDWIGEGIAELVIERLQNEPGVGVFSREERLAGFDKLGIPDATLVSRATALKLGWDTGADNIVTGKFSGLPEQFEISARVVDMEGGASEEIRVQGRLEDVILLTATLSRRLLQRIVPGSVSPEADYTARPPAPRSAFENYVRGILSSDSQKRADLLQTAIRLYPQYASALFQLGRAFHLDRDFKSSSLWLEKVTENSPHRRQAQFMIALNYFYLGDYATALNAFQQLPPTYDVLLNLGASQSQSGDQAGAIATWKRAAGIDPLASEAFFNIGYTSFMLNDWEGAARNLGESLRLRGRDSEALFLLGRAYEKQGRHEDAQRLIARAGRLSQRVERWSTQPLPKLERLAHTTVFRTREEVWTDRRIERRARAQDLPAWLELIQNQIDSNSYGEAIRELQYLLGVFPDSSEARSLRDDLNQRRTFR